MTYVGAPMIYYGDEVGMWGPDDPSNRKPMLWPDLGPYERKDRVDPEHLAHYRAVGQLRRRHGPPDGHLQDACGRRRAGPVRLLQGRRGAALVASARAGSPRGSRFLRERGAQSRQHGEERSRRPGGERRRARQVRPGPGKEALLASRGDLMSVTSR